ncbi:MAG: rod shape-determining protein MreD [Thermodesulfobacteriota bacterium]
MTLFLLFFSLGFFLLACQTSLLPLLPQWLGRPDLLFILIIFVAVRLPFYTGLFLCFLFGMLVDGFSGYYLGLHALTYLLFFFLLRGLSSRLALQYALHQPILAATGSLLTNISIFLLANMLNETGQFKWVWRDVLLQALMVAIFAVPLIFVFEGGLDFCTRRSTPRRRPRRHENTWQPGTGKGW